MLKSATKEEVDLGVSHACVPPLVAIVVNPQAQAGEFRRAMFILCTLALTGTEDQLIQAKGKGEVWAKLGWWGRLDLRVSTGLPLPRDS